MTTQFGGGKTHSLTLLYHLARGGPEAAGWKGVRTLLEMAGVTEIPRAAMAVFVGTEFDSIAGRGGADGTPVRKTPWGEIAWQLGGAEGLRVVTEHDASLTAPGGDVVARILPADRPVLILLDELMNYVSRSRKSGLGGQLYNFLHNLSEVARSRDNVVLAVSIPASELEMTAEDQSDYERLKKLLDRLGKAMIMSVEAEASEIIRRRLFEWHRVPADASKTVGEYVKWMAAHRHQLPSWFPVDNAREALSASYPFHPSVLSVFERKWQALPRFQQTRGILRLMALWVSHAYIEGFKGAHKDPLITVGTAPLDNPTFRAAVFEQLGESRLEAAVTTDIAGKAHAHALRLDKEATAEVSKARLHRKVATAIFFESNGGQKRGEATLPEIRLAVAEPDLDIGKVEQGLEALADTCYFLSAEKTRYRFQFPAKPQQTPRRPTCERPRERDPRPGARRDSRRSSRPARASSASTSQSARTRCPTARRSRSSCLRRRTKPASWPRHASWRRWRASTALRRGPTRARFFGAWPTTARCSAKSRARCSPGRTSTANRRRSESTNRNAASSTRT